MGKRLIAMCCLLACTISAVEAEIQFENDQVRASKVKIMAHEEIGLHRDAYPRVVISLKGGTISRLEADGSVTDIDFPKGEAVFMKPDPVDQLHSSVNKTCKSVELIIIELKEGPSK